MLKTVALSALVVAFAVGATPAAADPTGDTVARNFQEADVDADGVLTLSEFTTLIDLNARDGIGRSAVVQRFGQYGMAFMRVDVDMDGRVTPEEMAAIAARAQR